MNRGSILSLTVPTVLKCVLIAQALIAVAATVSVAWIILANF
jgi:hypothetical protein